ncbi:MAG: PilZ domain-containing protein [Acidiferrobacterales bacterium]
MTNKPLPANRRLAQRRVTDVKVFASDGSEIKKCRLRDISLDGAFIETKNVALTKGAKLDLVLRISRKGKTTACPLPAKVVRAEKGGAALMFGNLNEHVYKILLDIVNPPSW